MSSRASLSGLGLSATLFFGGAMAAQARDCRDNIRHQEARLRQDIDRHGYGSRQARHDRHELEEARNGCRNRDRRNWNRNSRRSNDHDRDDRWRKDRDRRWRDDR